MRRPPARPQRLGIESLENRVLPAPTPIVGAGPPGRPVGDDRTETLPIRISPDDFTAPSGRVLLRVGLTPSDAAPLEPGPLAAVAPGRGATRAVPQRPAGSGTLLALVRAGTYALPVAGGPLDGRSYQLRVGLAGDVDGDLRVGRDDLRAIRGLLRRTAIEPDVPGAADLDGDDRVTPRDWRLARRNLGAVTRVRPLAVGLELDRSSDPDGDGVVTRPDVTIAGRTTPGATVRLDRGSDGSFEQVTTSDGSGSYAFALAVDPGTTPVRVEATDACGQRTMAQRTVTRADTVVAVGSTLDLTVRPGDLSGPQVVYTITPQPLPAGATFDRGTGRFRFAPAPGQVGLYSFAVTASDGTRTATQRLPITVTHPPRDSTAVSGQVVDEAGRPLAGVPVALGTLRTVTDRDGRFRLDGVAGRPGPLVVDGSHAAGAGDLLTVMAPVDQFLGHPLHDRADNVVAEPITVPRVDLAHATDFGRVDRGRPQDLTSPLLPGVALHVAPDSARTRDGKPFTGKLSLTALPVDKLRAVLPPGEVPGTMIGVDGPDLMFETPAKLTLPNVDGHAPGAVLRLMTMNMATGAFEVSGHLRVSADGRTLETVDGGFRASSCGYTTERPPGQAVPITDCLDCQATGNGSAPPGSIGDFGPRTGVAAGGTLFASDAGLVTGEYYQDHPIVAYQSLGRARGIDLQYSSLQADPRPVVQFAPTVMDQTVTPIQKITAAVSLGGVTQGADVTFTGTTGLGGTQRYRVPLQVDATALGTGAYRYDMTVTQHFGVEPQVAMSTGYAGTVDVINASASPLGAGWSVGGLQRVWGAAGGPVLVTAGARGAEHFHQFGARPIADLAMVTDHYGYTGLSGLARVVRNDGLAGFDAPGAGGTTAGTPRRAVAGDFDGDGVDDLATIAGMRVAVSRADGAGGFDAATTVAMTATPLALAVGHFHGAPAVLDLAVLRADGTVAVLPGNGDGTFAAAVVTTVAGGAASGSCTIAAGDFDGDGASDLAVAQTGDGKLRVLRGAGAGGFSAQAAYTLPNPATGRYVVAGDFTNDGALDLAVAGGTTLTMLVGDGAGGFAAGGTDTHFGGPIDGLVAGNFYRPDRLAVAAWIRYDRTIITLEGGATGDWGTQFLYGGIGRGDPLGLGNDPTSPTLAAADLNGDGRSDLVISHGSGGQLEVLVSDPDTNQLEPVRRVDVGADPVVLAAGAFTGRSTAARYVGPLGDPSALVHHEDGTWTRSYPDGTTLRFDAAGRQVSEADRNGNTTTYAYVASGPAAGALQTVTDPAGLVTTLAYDASGHLTTITDPAGRVTQVTVDADGNLTRIVDPDGAVTQFGYATPGNHRITTEVNPNGRTATAHYDAFGRLTGETLFDGASTSLVAPAEVLGLLAPGGTGPLPLPGGYRGTVTDPNGHTTTLPFDTMGHPVSAIDARNQTTTYVRDRNGWPTAVTDPLNRTTRSEYDASGNATRITRPDNLSMTVAYDPAFSVPTRVTDFRGLTTVFTLDARGNVLRRTDPDLLYEEYTYNAAGQVLTATDRNGRTTTYRYDARGRLDRITDPGAGGPAVGFTYDAAGNLLTVTDELGHVTSYTYDAAGRVLSMQDPVQAALGVRTSYTYDPAGNRTTMTDALGRVTSYGYDARDRLISIVDPVNQGTGRQTTLAYDGMNLTGVTDPLGHATAYAYDELNRRTGVTDALNHATTRAYDAAGQLASITDANGHTTTLTYDAAGRVRTRTLPGTVGQDEYGNPVPVVSTYGYDGNDNLTSIIDPLGHLRSFTYDALDRLTSASAALDPYGYETLTTTFGYDAVGNRTSVTDPLGRVTAYAYDARDRLTGVTLPDPDGAGPQAAPVLGFGYDAVGNRTSVTDPLGRVTAYAHDGSDRLTTATAPDPDGAGPQAAPVTRYGYDAVGNRTSVTDPLGRVTAYAYDARDRLTGVTLPDPDGAGPQAAPVLGFGYDAVGNRTSVTDPLGQVTTTAYDALDRVIAVTDPRSGQTTFAYDAVGNRTGVTDPLGNRTTYAYDALDRLTAMTDPLGRSRSFAYDAAGQLTAATDRLGRQRTFAYDGLGRRTAEQWRDASGGVVRTITSTYDAADQLTGVSDPDATLTFAYDGLGREISAATSGAGLGQPNVTLSSAYDAAGNRTRLADDLAGAGVTTYAYDALDRLTTITRSLGGVAGPQVSLGYDAADRLTSLARTVGGAGTAVTSTLAYDALDRITTLTHQGAGGAALAAYGYGYDAAGRLTGESNAEGAVSYTYDATGQLTGVTGERSETYSYDLNGNRNGAGYTTGAGNRLEAAPGYTLAYDAEGNLASKTETATGQVTTYAYDNRNRLTGVTTKDAAGAVVAQATYTYDALDRRIGTAVDADGAGPGAPATTWTVYDGENPYADFDGTGALRTRYLHGPAVDWLLARTSAVGATAWYLTDRQGSVRDVADAAGAVIYHTGYDSFGTKVNESGTGGDRYGYTGREHDAATGQRYHRGRYFDEALDRWTQEDPIGFAAGDPNLYRYVGNGPTNSVDPSGLAPLHWDRDRLHGDIPPLDYLNQSMSCNQIYDWIEAVRTSLKTRWDKVLELRWRTDPNIPGFNMYDYLNLVNEQAGHVQRYNDEIELLKRLLALWFDKCGGDPRRPAPQPKPPGDISRCTLARIDQTTPAREPVFHPQSVRPTVVPRPRPLPVHCTPPGPQLTAPNPKDPLIGKPYTPPPLAPWEEDLLERDFPLPPGRLPAPVTVPGPAGPPGGGPGRTPAWPGRTNPVRPGAPIRVPAR
jgi:RHS repeat-associated protein